MVKETCSGVWEEASELLSFMLRQSIDERNDRLA